MNIRHYKLYDRIMLGELLFPGVPKPARLLAIKPLILVEIDQLLGRQIPMLFY